MKINLSDNVNRFEIENDERLDLLIIVSHDGKKISDEQSLKCGEIKTFINIKSIYIKEHL